MTLNPIRYVLDRRVTQPRFQRLWAMFTQNFSLRARTGPLLLAALGFALTFVPLLALMLIRLYVPVPIFAPLSLSSFAIDFDNGGLSIFLFLFVLLMTTLVGSGIISDDLKTRSITLYLSRPITVLDYLAAKASVVGIFLALLCMIPGALTAILITLIGGVSATIGLEAFFAFLGVGLLMTAVFSGVGVFFSSMTDRRAFSGVAIFAVLLADDLFAAILAGVTNNVSWLYVSPWQDVLEVGQAAFSVTPAPGDHLSWGVSLAVLLGLTVALYAVVYLRLSRLEVVTD